MSTDPRITAELDVKMKDVLALDEKQAGSQNKWNQCLVLLRDARLCYVAKFHTSQVLVHPDNRGGLGFESLERASHSNAVLAPWSRFA